MVHIGLCLQKWPKINLFFEFLHFIYIGVVPLVFAKNLTINLSGVPGGALKIQYLYNLKVSLNGAHRSMLTKRANLTFSLNLWHFIYREVATLVHR